MIRWKRRAGASLGVLLALGALAPAAAQEDAGDGVTEEQQAESEARAALTNCQYLQCMPSAIRYNEAMAEGFAETVRAAPAMEQYWYDNPSARGGRHPVALGCAMADQHRPAPAAGLGLAGTADSGQARGARCPHGVGLEGTAARPVGGLRDRLDAPLPGPDQLGDLARRPGRAETALPGLALVAALSALTVQRNALYADPVALWRQAVEQAPERGRPWIGLGHALLEAGNLAEAERALAEGLARDPWSLSARRGLELVAGRRAFGAPSPAEEVER